MNRRRTIAALAHALWLCCLFLASTVNSSEAGQIVSGSYSVTETSELGAQVRVTLQIHLTNAGEQRLFITQMSLQNVLRPGRVSEERSAVILESHAGTEITRQFNLSKDEFEALRQSARPRLSLKIQAADGVVTTVTIALMRRPG